MDAFTPATDIWVPGFDQFDRPCWQNKRTRKIHYDLTGQLPRNFGHTTDLNLLNGPYFRPEIGTFPLRDVPEHAEWRSTASVVGDNKTAFGSSSKDTPPLSPSLRDTPSLPPGLSDMPSLPPGHRDTPSTTLPPSGQQSQSQSPALPISRAEKAKQWSRKRDIRGEYYLNSVTGETQSETPDCLKKYTRRF